MTSLLQGPNNGEHHQRSSECIEVVHKVMLHGMLYLGLDPA